MTNTTTETAIQAGSTDTAPREDLEVLDRARNAVQEIEVGVDEVNDLMMEFILAADLPDEVRALADNLGAKANELFEALDTRLTELRREVAGADDDADEEDATAT
jgi:guanylate kinase